MTFKPMKEQLLHMDTLLEEDERVGYLLWNGPSHTGEVCFLLAKYDQEGDLVFANCTVNQPSWTLQRLYQWLQHRYYSVRPFPADDNRTAEYKAADTWLIADFLTIAKLIKEVL